MSGDSFSQNSYGYALTTIIPGSLPGIPVAIYLRSSFEIVATSTSLFTLLIFALSIIFGEYSDLLRIKTPYVFREIIANERGEEMYMYNREWLLKKLGLLGLFRGRNIIGGEHIPRVEPNFYEQTSDKFVDGLADIISADNENLRPVYLYEGLLSYLGQDQSARTKRRRRRLLFLQNIRISALSAVVLIGILLIEEGELILTAGLAFVLLVFLAYAVIMTISLYFLTIGRVDEEYIQSLIMDFYVKQEKTELN